MAVKGQLKRSPRDGRDVGKAPILIVGGWEAGFVEAGKGVGALSCAPTAGAAAASGGAALSAGPGDTIGGASENVCAAHGAFAKQTHARHKTA